MSILPGEERFPHDPEEDSVEDVREILRGYDQQLAAQGHIPSEEEPEARIFNGYTLPLADLDELLEEAQRQEAIELANEGLAEYVKSLRTMLFKIGLADPGSVITENVREAGSDILEQLDSLNAEALFYDVAKRVRQDLGSEGLITWGRLIERARPKNLDGTDGEAIHLDKLRLGQNLSRVGDLGRLGIIVTTLDSAEREQNVTRLAHVYYEDPNLEQLRRSLQNKTEQEALYITMTKAVDFAKQELKRKIEQLEDYRRALEEQVADQHMDSIAQEVWDKQAKSNKIKLRQAKSSLAITDIILEAMQVGTIEELVEDVNRNDRLSDTDLQ